MKCSKCDSEEVWENPVDGRKLFVCRSCGHREYSQRATVGPVDVILDDIADDVIVKGEAECAVSVLGNVVWPRSDDLAADIRKWANSHGFSFYDHYKKEGKQEHQFLTFFLKR